MRRRFCSRPYEHVHLDPNGNVRICSWMDVGIGNLLEADLNTVWTVEQKPAPAAAAKPINKPADSKASVNTESRPASKPEKSAEQKPVTPSKPTTFAARPTAQKTAAPAPVPIAKATATPVKRTIVLDDDKY